jgi:phosphohistidine phosphatase
MLLLLIRHADAGDRDPDRWPDDRDRPITDKGRKATRRMGRRLGKLGLAPTRVLASPWLRAAQTAAVLAEKLELSTPVVPCTQLATNPDLIRLTDAVGEHGPDAIVALVGHSPWMEELAGRLLVGSETKLRVDFPKSGVMGIDLERIAPGAGELRFFLRPR